MTQPKLDPATIAQHEKLFETQIDLQTRLLDHIEQEDAFEVLDDAWEEFTLYNNIPMDPEDPEPVLHFFPWALFYWRRDVSDEAFADDTDVDEDMEEDDIDDETWLDEIDALSEDQISDILSDALEDDAQSAVYDDGIQTTFPPLATLFMNSVDGADGSDSPLTGQTLSVLERQFIEAAANAPYSFFQVTEIGPGPFVTLQDLIVPATVQVYAQVLVDMLEDNDVVYGQVVTVDDASVLCGVAPAVLPPIVLDALAEARERIEAIVPEMSEDWRHEMEFELRSLYQEFVSELQEIEGGDEDNVNGEDDEDARGGDRSEVSPKH